MLRYINILCSGIIIFLITGCSSNQGLSFANKEWLISNYSNEVLDNDSIFNFSFGNIDYENTPLIGKGESKYLSPQLANYLSDVLKLSNLQSAKVLLYAPKENKVFVLLPENYEDNKPSSISFSMNDSTPWTMWVRPDDVELWNRQPDQMYTNLYRNKKKGIITVVDKFNYGDTPIAQIYIIQSANKNIINKFPNNEIGSVWADINKTESLELLSNWIDGHRKVSLTNYRNGKKEKIQALNPEWISSKADSCLYKGDYAGALDYYMTLINNVEHINYYTLYNAACAASKAKHLDDGINLLNRIIREFPEWYLSEPIDTDLDNLRQHENWEEINDTIKTRRSRIEANFNQELRRRLKEIRKSDQDVRHEFLNAYTSQPVDTVLTRSLLQQMQIIDKKNLEEIKIIIEEFGWPNKDLVGDECITIWLVIQHSDVETQKWALPYLKEGAKNRDIDASAIAMLEDRILVNSGKNQIYGTQFYWEELNGQNTLRYYPIEDMQNLNKRRAEVGLDTFEEEFERMKNRR